VSDEQLLAGLQQEREALLLQYAHLAVLPLRQSKMRCGNGGINDNRSDMYHVEFEGRSVQSRELHRVMMENELRMRNIVPDGTQAAELRIQLSEILLTENSYNILCKVLAANSLDEAMVKLEKAIPCLLHLENRSSEAIISRLVHRGWELREDSPEATRQFISLVETLINEKLFGSPECKSSWQFPLEEDGSMGDFKFANWRARRIMLHYNDLVEICLPGDERAEERNSWSSVASLYRDCIMVCLFYFYFYFQPLYLMLYLLTIYFILFCVGSISEKRLL
jgi:hypothetical protein